MHDQQEASATGRPRRMRTGWLLSGLLAATAAVWVVWSDAPSREVGVAPAEAIAAALPATEGRVAIRADNPLAESSPALVEPTASSGEARTAVAASVLSGRVVGPAGQPVAGASVSWGPLPARHIIIPYGWHEVDWSAAERATRWAMTDDAGAFAFESAPDADEMYGTVLWATHPEWRAVSAMLAPTHPGGAIAPLETERVPRRTVKVVDRAARPVAGATVWQHSAARGVESDEVLALRAFFRRSRTDPGGITPAFSLRSDEVLVAENDSARSAPRIGPARGHVTLALEEQFTASGTIVLTDGGMLEEWPRVTWGAVRDGRCEPIGAQRHEGGLWGPVSIPIVDADAYRFELRGGGVVEVAHEIEVPSPGQTVRVDLETVQGVDLWFLVQNTDGEILHDASIEVMWREGAQWPRLQSPPARKDGTIYMRGTPPGTIHYEASAPGYATARFGPYEIPEAESTTWQSTLGRAGSVVGRCLYEGAPVSDFKISSCPPGQSHERLSHRFEGRADGSFEIDSLAEGEQVLIAFAHGLGQSAPLHVHVVAGQTRQAQLALSPPVAATGRVVDAVARRPIAGVEVQRVVIYDNTAVGSVGDTVRTDEQGWFSLEGLAKANSGAFFTADGYSRETRTAPHGNPIDFGVVELVPLQPVEFVLPPTVRPDGFRIAVDADRVPLEFPSDGVLVVDAFEGGRHDFRVFFPDEKTLLDFARTLTPGEEWIVPVPVEGGEYALDLTVVPPGDEPLPEDLWAFVQYRHSDGESLGRFQPVDETGRLTFEGLPGDGVHASIRDGRNRVRASGQGSFGEAPRLELRLHLDAEPRRFRVVDGRDNPVPSASLWFHIEGSEFASLSGSTDADGELVLAGLPTEGLFATVAHDALGRLCDWPVIFDEDSVATIVLDPLETIEARILRGIVPVEDQLCLLYSRKSHHHAGSAITDRNGKVRWDRLSPGDYLVELDGKAFWPVSEPISTGRDTALRIPVYRIGSIELEVRDSEGFPARRTNLQIRSDALDTPVRKWAEAGKIDLPGGIVTDDRGRLVLRDIPEGTYSWSFIPSAGLMVGGGFEVVAGEFGATVLKLP